MVSVFFFWVCCGLLGYVYLLYPALVALLAPYFGRPVRRGNFLPKVTIIVTAYNEQKRIRAKLDNLTGLAYPAHLMDIVVASDGSSDATEEISASYDPPRVRALHIPGRRGKTACQNAAALVATGEILVFTDATTRLHPAALRRLVENFADPETGCVSGRPDNITSYELRLRAAESLLGSLIGVSGCLYAVRRSAYRAISPDLISDFVIAMQMQEQGLRTVLAPDAVCFESTLDQGSHVLAMRVRAVIRNLHALIQLRRFLNPAKYGRFAWQLWSHKVLRYATPLLWLSVLAANVMLMATGPWPATVPYLVLLVAQIAVIVARAVGLRA
jgi:cellulose synthase/poly-beta-1,6-N-acetylglucosamine synthase-like glycosyltransferase